ncbi:MAG: 2-succinyl-5-enolpyruvyl-6-hydroxy-3-cyclohexene-1-carboxylic-acid synthase, partial [Bacillus sp. (in: firmicutes)]
NFELLFGTPLDLEFEHAVKMFKGEFTRIEDWDHLGSEMMKATNQTGLKVFEFRTNRDVNRDEHRGFWSFVSREISNFVKGVQ